MFSWGVKAPRGISAILILYSSGYLERVISPIEWECWVATNIFASFSLFCFFFFPSSEHLAKVISAIEWEWWPPTAISAYFSFLIPAAAFTAGLWRILSIFLTQSNANVFIQFWTQAILSNIGKFFMFLSLRSVYPYYHRPQIYLSFKSAGT